MVTASSVERLAGLASLGAIPRTELEWLAAHSQHEICVAGEIVAPKGKRVDRLMVILSGRIGVYVDKGTGPRRVMSWQSGEVTGMLPYSRMAGPPGDNRCEEETELLTVNEGHFREMASSCPVFTAYTVHLMLDRARGFTTSDLQDEKMISLGKLSAGLAHELNNPASAVVRSAALLRACVESADESAGFLRMAGASEALFTAITRACPASSVTDGLDRLSPVDRADREDEVADWMQRHGIHPANATAIVDSGASIASLDALAAEASGATLESALRWMAARCEARALTTTIERAATRIYELVAAVKRFTFMDNLGVSDVSDVGQGLRDTLSILTSKTKAKGAVVTLKIEEGLPRVRAVGGELNQVWLNVLDNALDAIPRSGRVTVRAGREGDRVVVRVSDNGPGIPQEIVARIFDPFFTTKPLGEGTGLGLDIARRLLRRHHADITVESAPGRTEFCISLQAESLSRPDA